MNEIEVKLQELADARAAVKTADEGMKALIEAAKATKEYQDAMQAKISKYSLVTELEKEIKDWAFDNYDGKNKKPHAKVSIKTFDVSKVVYLPNKARDWCMNNFTPALILDTKKFESAVLDGSVPADVAVIEVASEDRVQIAADLTEYLSGE